MNFEQLAIFAPSASRVMGERICGHLGSSLSNHEEKEFDDGEHKSRPLVSVRGKDVFVISSLHGDVDLSVNDKLCRFLFFLGTLRDASAARITAIAPYLCYSRKDKRNKDRDPVTTRYVAAMFEAVGVDRVVTMDVHNLAAFQNAFRIRTENLEAKSLLAEYFAPLVRDENVTIVSPDAGGVKRAEDFRQALGRATGRMPLSAFLEKHRSEGVLSGSALIGDVAGRTAILVDDLISSGSTLVRGAETCRAHGAKQVFAAATHAVFSSKAPEMLSHPALEKVVVTDTVPVREPALELLRHKLVVLDTAKFLADVIRELHTDGSLVALSNR